MTRSVKRLILHMAMILLMAVFILCISSVTIVHAQVQPSTNLLNQQALGFYESRGSTKAVNVINKSVLDGNTHLNNEDDATSLINMLAALEFIDECNELRAQHGLQALKVNDYCMAVAQAQLNWSDTHYQHKQEYYVGENLSWGLSDPFDGWYTQEKAEYDKGNTAAAGHYLNIINSDYTVTGFALDTDPSNRYQGIAHGQTFDFSANGAETVSQYRQDLIDYCNQVGRVATNMYRLYNPNSGEHFYTASTSERNHLTSVGWKSEGIGWTAPAFSDTPVFRLYNANAGDHHYTTNMDEVLNLINAGWDYEGIGWYSDIKKDVPLYRQYNPNAKSGSHNYTTSQTENNHLASLGWRAEGIGWYGMK